MKNTKAVKIWTWDDYEPEKLAKGNVQTMCQDCKQEVPCRLEKETNKFWCSNCWCLYIGTGGCSFFR